MKTALLLIDVQESFRHRPYFRRRCAARLSGAHQRADRRLQRPRRAGGAHPARRRALTPGPFSLESGHVRPLDGLARVRRRGRRSTSTRHSALVGTGLPVWLREQRHRPARSSPASAPSNAARRPRAMRATKASRSTSCPRRRSPSTCTTLDGSPLPAADIVARTDGRAERAASRRICSVEQALAARRLILSADRRPVRRAAAGAAARPGRTRPRRSGSPTSIAATAAAARRFRLALRRPRRRRCTARSVVALAALEPLPERLAAPTWVVLRRPAERRRSRSRVRRQRAWLAARDWLVAAAPAARSRRSRELALLTVCSGTLLAADAGLLGTRRCTTHHELLDELRRLAPQAAGRSTNRVFVDRRPAGRRAPA